MDRRSKLHAARVYDIPEINPNVDKNKLLVPESTNVAGKSWSRESIELSLLCWLTAVMLILFLALAQRTQHQSR